MFISIITANYNGARYINQAMESVLSQTHENFEYIIVDDGSTDGSTDTIHRAHQRARNRIVPVYVRTNRGQAHAFNRGMAKARGDIVCFLDSDDYWFSDKLARVEDAFLRNPEIAMFQHNLAIHDVDGLTTKCFADILWSGDGLTSTRKSLRLPKFIPTSGLAFRRKVLKAIQPIPIDFRTCADGYLTRTGFCHGPVASDHNCFGAYRVHDGNHTFNNTNFDFNHYRNGLLIPALNRYYRERGISLRFPKRGFNGLYLSSPRDLLRGLLSPPRFNWVDTLMKRFG